jgi:hypothetical protein
MNFRVKSASMQPGAIAISWMPYGASSIAIERATALNRRTMHSGTT